jgi:hypothetical protein
MAPSARARLGTKRGASRRGGAVRRTYCQGAGRVPARWPAGPRAAIRHLAQRVGGSPAASRHDALDERLARDPKEQRRQGTGCRQGQTTDAEARTAWGGAHRRVEETTLPVLSDRLPARDPQLPSALPTPGRLARLAHAAAQTVEEPCLARRADALTPDTRHRLDARRTARATPGALRTRKIDAGRRRLNRLEGDVEQRPHVQRLPLPQDLLVWLSTRSLRRMTLRVTTASRSAPRRPPDPRREGLGTLFCSARTPESTDRLVARLLHRGRTRGVKAEKRVEAARVADGKRGTGPPGLLVQRAAASLAPPRGRWTQSSSRWSVRRPLRARVTESRATGRSSREQVHPGRRGSASHPDRRMGPPWLSVLAVHAQNAPPQPVRPALALVPPYPTRKRQLYGAEEGGPWDGVGPQAWQETGREPEATGQLRGPRLTDARPTLPAWRERVRGPAIWVPGAQRSRQPEAARPAACAEQRPLSSQARHKPREPETLLPGRQRQRPQAWQRRAPGLPPTPGVKRVPRPQGGRRGATLARPPAPPPCAGLTAARPRRWPWPGL